MFRVVSNRQVWLRFDAFQQDKSAAPACSSFSGTFRNRKQANKTSLRRSRRHPNLLLNDTSDQHFMQRGHHLVLFAGAGKGATGDVPVQLSILLCSMETRRQRRRRHTALLAEKDSRSADCVDLTRVKSLHHPAAVELCWPQQTLMTMVSQMVTDPFAEERCRIRSTRGGVHAFTNGVQGQSQGKVLSSWT